MYYAKYIKYKNKYINLKYQLGGTLEKPLQIKELIYKTIPDISTTLEPIAQTIKFLENNLIGLKVLDTDSKVLTPLVVYNKEFYDNKIYFYRYTDKKGQSYILCSLYSNRKIFEELQKKDVRIQKISIDELGNVSLLIKNISTLQESTQFNIENVKKKLMDELVGIKILEINTTLLKNLIDKLKDFKKHNHIYFYRYTDKKNGKSYILCSLFSYYEFLDILYEHIEIEEVVINVIKENVVITLVETDRIYHIIPKPDSGVPNKTVTLPIKNTEISSLSDLIGALSCNLFIITNNEYILPTICMYNLFIGTVHVFEIIVNDRPNDRPNVYFLLSLFTEYELNQKCIYKPPNVKLNECRLYKQGKKIEFILNKNLVSMMFCKYMKDRADGYHKVRYYRGDPAIDNIYLNELDPTLLDKCRECISVDDIANNTTLWLLPENIEAKNHPDILEMKNDFLKNEFELINSNEKIQLWRYNFEDLIQLREYSLEDLKKEVEKLKQELLGLEPCHKELLVQKLIEKGYGDIGDTMDEILQKNTLCYLEKEDKNKKLVYENTKQIEPKDNEFVNNLPYMPEMKELLEKGSNLQSELHKYRQTILFLREGNDIEKKYKKNQLYFFIDSFYIPRNNINFDKTFNPLAWSAKLNKLCFHCLAMKDWLIFPLRIVNIKYFKSPLAYEFNIDKQKFCGYFYTRFTDNHDGINNFKIKCRDKFYFIYYNNNKQINYKEYQLFYYTGNLIWLEISMLPNYKISLCEINWIYYTFILKYGTIPYFYKYINDDCEEEIVVSKFSLEQIRCIYLANGYDTLELDVLIEVFYNHNFYRRKDITEKIFVDKSLFSSKEKQDDFIRNVFIKNNISR